MRSLKAVLNESNPNKLASAAQAAMLGSILALSTRVVVGAVATHVLALPDGAKAAAILWAFATAGSSTGLKTPVYGGSAGSAGQVAINATGDIVFNATDAVTSAEVVYLSVEGEVIEETVQVATGTGLCLQGRRIAQLLSATATAGSVTGAKTVIGRGGAPATTQACANLLGTGVSFNVATDAVTQATIRYIARPGFGPTPGPAVPALSAETSAL